MQRNAFLLFALTAVALATAAGAQTYDNKYARKFVLGDNSSPVVSLTLKTPTTITSAYSLTFPAAVGALGQLLVTTDAAGTLGWTDPATLLSSTYWSLAGNASASAYNGTTGSYLGTTSAFPLVLATTNATAQPIEFFTGGSERMRVGSTGSVGIGTNSPNVNLDVAKDFATRELNYATSFASGSTTNDLSFDGLTPANQTSLVRLAAAAGPFTVTGFAGGQNGKMLTLSNRTGQAITLSNLSGSVAANQILTGSGANLTVPSNGIINLQYSATDSKWILRSLGGNAGQAWSLVGNAGTTPGVAANQNYFGTSDAQNLIIATNATERMRVLSTGNIGVNSTTAPQLITLGGDIGIVGNGSKVTASGTAAELIMEETNDTYGTSRLRLQDRNGSNGALFQQSPSTAGIDLVDFGFIPGAKVQSNIRLEARSADLRGGQNTSSGTGEEFQFLFASTQTTPQYVLSIGQNATLLESGKFGIGYAGSYTTFPAASPLELLDVHTGNIILSNSGTSSSTGTAGILKFQGTNDGISSFVAGAQGSTNINYTLPTSTPTANQVLTASAVAAPAVTLSWATPAKGISVYAGNTGANSANNDFISMGGTGKNAAENTTQIVVTRAGTLQNLYVNLTAAPGGATAKTITVRKNGANTALAVTVTGAATNGNNTANAISVAAGDLLSIQITNTGAPANSIVAYGFEVSM